MPGIRTPVTTRIRASGFGLVSAFLFLLAGCAVGPKYHRPPVNLPAQYRNETGPGTNSLAELPWWEIFKDDALQGLIRTALTNNFDLLIAITRVEQAQALAMQARAGFFPTLNYQGTAARGKNSLSGFAVPNGQTSDFFLLTGTASWELDLWGRVRRMNEAAQAQFLASKEAQRGVQISLISQVAQAYFQLLALDGEIEIARRATNAFSGSLKIFTERLGHGVASRLETSSAEAPLASAAAAIPELERQAALQEDEINVLVGRYTGPVPRNDSLIERFVPPSVPAGLPSALLERRPDIREADQLARAANAQVGVAVANFFPQFTLTALFGQVSPALSAFTSGGANAWNIAANVAGPILEGGRLVGEYRQAKAVRAQNWLQYQASVLSAFREVSDALISREKLAQARIEQERSVTAYKEAVHIATERYRLGQSSYYEVLQEQEELYPAENTLLQTKLNQFLSIIQLYRALGGGWEKGEHD